MILHKNKPAETILLTAIFFLLFFFNSAVTVNAWLGSDLWGNFRNNYTRYEQQRRDKEDRDRRDRDERDKRCREDGYRDKDCDQPNPPCVPEFGLMTGVMALVASGGIVYFLRKNNKNSN